MEPLPLAPPACSLDADGLRAQRDGYRRAGAGARVLERDARRLVMVLAPGADADEVQRLVEVERECCPFFALGWDPVARRLAVSVARAEDEPALEAIAFALGLPEPLSAG